jgi:hypothetical protein
LFQLQFPLTPHVLELLLDLIKHVNSDFYPHRRNRFQESLRHRFIHWAGRHTLADGVLPILLMSLLTDVGR